MHMKSVDPIARSESLTTSFKLPHVGIPHLRAQELDEHTGHHRNPYSIPKRTELMLINNERMRIQEQMTREKMKNLYSVQNKGTSNFRNREGVIREIRSILPIDEQPGYQHSMTAKKNMKRYDQIVPSSGERLNIFEGDPQDIDSKLKLIERDNGVVPQNKSLVPTSDPTQTLDITNQSSKWNGNLNYLKNQLQIKETRKDFVLNSRELLFMEISIRNKKEETEKLKEFIDTENEKL